MMHKLLLVFFVLALSVACAPTEKKKIATGMLDLVEEYPMEGSNTLTAVWTFNSDEVDADKIKSARVLGAKLICVHPETSDLFEEITLSLAASGADMQKVGVLNPVPNGQNTLNLGVADAQKHIAKLLQQKEITLVFDMNLSRDLEQELHLQAELEFEIEI